MHLTVFADDWGRHPSSCQHIVHHLCNRYDVTWVNTIGMRTPKLDRVTVARALGKFREWSWKQHRDKGDDSTHGPTVISPRMWPWFTRKHDRLLNRHLLSRAVNRILPPPPSQAVAITTIPIVADLVGQIRVARWIYYCVDDFSQWPGLDGRTLEQMERELVQKVDTIVVASDVLRKRVNQMGRESTVLTHGVDVDFWTAPAGDASPASFRAIEEPRVVFWGVVDGRIDVAYIKALSQKLQQGTIVLMGPQQNPPAELARLSRVHMAPPARLSQLPAVAHEAAVLIMPYADLEVTRAMQPLKLKEYLATGRPVVASDLPAVQPWEDCLDIARSPDEFADRVVQRIAENISPEQAACRSRRLPAESWEVKARQFEALALPSEAGSSHDVLAVAPPTAR